MSLQVWLPLTKDLRQQGLSNTMVTNNGATFNSAGKLGGCYSFDGSNDYFSLTNFDISGWPEFTLAFWCYTNTNLNGVFAVRDSGTYRLALTDSTFVYRDSQHSALTSVTITQPNQNTWTHYVISYNNGIINIYQNGNLIVDSVGSSGAVLNNANEIRIGRRQTSSADTYYNGKLNDVRIYDHCLSPMEVKQISQGLVLHYPLNRNGWGQENLISGTDDWSTWYKGARWTAENGILTYSAGAVTWVDADSPCIPWTDIDGKTITVSCELRSDDFDYTSGSGFSLCLVRKSSQAAQNHTNRRRECTPIHAVKNEVPTTWKHFSHTYINFSDSDFTNTYNGGGGDWFGIYLWNYTNKSIQIKNIKVEIGDKVTSWCPNSADALATTMGLNSTIEYDCSGFCNNSTRNANTTYSSNTPKYSVSTFWGAVNTPKATLNDKSILSSLTNCTVAWWENCTTTGNTLLFSGQTQYYYIGAGNNSNPLYDNNIGTSGITLYKDGVAVNTSYSGQRVNHTGTYHIKDEWHHYVLTGVNLSTWTTFIINGYSSWPLKAYVSDIRIYATALSADDVKSLYQNSAYIDSSGNVYGTIHEV